MEPGTLALTGAIFSAVGAITRAGAEAKSANYNAAIADRNAGIARDQATADEALLRRNAAMRQGAARAAYGAAGVTLEGSPLDVLEASSSAAEYDALNIRYKGQLREMGYADQAMLNRNEANSATAAGFVNAGTALFGLATQKPTAGNRIPAPVEERTVGVPKVL